jgi:hypothetical protein
MLLNGPATFVSTSVPTQWGPTKAADSLTAVLRQQHLAVLQRDAATYRWV